MKYYLILSFYFIIYDGYAQFGKLGFLNKNENKTDTLYYPFYNGAQMIEVDHIGQWDRMIFYLEQSQPRAMPHSMFHPQPIGNEYFFRDTSGKIVQTFGSASTIEKLTKHFLERKISKQKTTKGLNHTSRSNFTKGIWAYSPQESYRFSGYYKIASLPGNTRMPDNEAQKAQSGVLYGLIDSLGKISLPIIYDELMPIDDIIVASKNKKWGIIKMNGAILVEHQFDEVQNIYLSQAENSILHFKTNNKYTAYYDLKTKQLHNLNEYDEVHWYYRDYSNPIIPVIKNGKLGWLDTNLVEVRKPQYDVFDYTNLPGLKRISRDGKFGFINRYGKEIIECKYDYAESFNKDSTAVVLLDGKYKIINTKDETIKEIDSYQLKTAHIIKCNNELYNTIYLNSNGRQFMGLINQNKKTFVLPVSNYKDFKTFNPGQPYVAYKKTDSSGYKIIHLPSLKETIGEYERMEPYKSRITIKQKGKCGVLDSLFNVIIEPKYQELNFCLTTNPYFKTEDKAKKFPNRYLVIIDKKFGIIDEKEEILLKPEYDYISCYTPMMYVQKEGKTGVMNRELELMIPIEYERVERSGYIGDDHFLAKKDGKYGIITKKNKVVLPFIYDQIMQADYNNPKGPQIKVRQRKKEFYVDYDYLK